MWSYLTIYLGISTVAQVNVQLSTSLKLFFFFQAEDGIRDLIVLEFRRVLFRSSSGNFRLAASICIRRTLRTPLRAMRSCAFSSIEVERSMPVTRQSRG